MPSDCRELNVRPETISLILGDTDRTPTVAIRQGFFLAGPTSQGRSLYLQALLGLAATQFGFPVSSLSVVDGIVSGGGKSLAMGSWFRGSTLI